ncbi:MAG: hypothetical protein WBW87_08300 [Candidatus Cybelea sp.]
MRISVAVVEFIAATAAIAFVAACSRGSQPGPPIPSDARAISTQPQTLSGLARSGRSPTALALMRLGQSAPRAIEAGKKIGLKDLYVAGYFPEKLVILKNTTYKNVGTISKGLVSPDGDFVDTSGNLYVADYDGVDVQEYKPGGKSPTFTYSAGMTDPVNVSVDARGNVYEADYDGHLVNEYSQKNDTVINSCPLAGGAEGVAVDGNNDVFVDYNLMPSGPGLIVEYKGGLAGCQQTEIHVPLDFAGGMVLDAKGKLIVCDEDAPAVDVIARPYSKITPLGSGYMLPFHITLNRDNKLAFVADAYDVYALNYPSGSLAATIGSADGLTYPAGAVDSENAVY